VISEMLEPLPALMTEYLSFFVITGVNAAAMREIMIKESMSSTKEKAKLFL